MEGLNKFCGSPFWDTNLTWNTDDPYFTPCFEQTLLVWAPAGLLLLLTALELYWRYCKSSLASTSSGPIPFSPLNITKSVLNTVLLVVQLVILFPFVFLADDYTDELSYVAINYPVDIWAPVLRSITYILALLLLFLTKAKGLRSSGSLFLFWTVAAVCDSIIFRSILHSPPETTAAFVIDVVSYVCTLALFLLNCWADVDPVLVARFDYQPLRGVTDAATISPEKGASYLSQLLFEWFGTIMWKGWRNPLDYKDLWDLNEEDRSAAIVPVFTEIWAREFARKKKHEQLSVLPVMFKAFGGPFVVGSMMKLIPDMMVFVSPMILQLLIGFINNPDEATWKGWLYTLTMFSSAIVQTIITAQYSHRMYVSGLRVRTALVNAIYRKALVVSNSTKRGTTLGEIVNLMSVDVQKIMDLVPFVNYLWTTPLQIAIALYFQWGIVGPSAIAGFIVLVLIVPINVFIVNKTRALQVEQMRFKDQRVKLMNEILSGIKVLKLYAWEPSFQSQIEAIRAKEIHVLRVAAYLSAGMNFLWMCAPFLISVATFATYVLIDETNTLDATKAFVSVSIFSVINFSVSLLPATITFATLAIVSLRRINKFMNSKEIDPDAVTHENERDPIIIEHGNFAWDENKDLTPPVPLLRDINLRVPQGSLIAVVGSVGCGKSTLLSALIGETNKLSGRVNTVGTIAYVAQQAWIQNVSLRDNILFGMQFDSSKYDKVVRACALKPDIEMLPGGDKTEIGEKGINLSGGQKQRVAVARAVYSNSDVYLFDDPLSAVDSHVGKHIFENVLGPAGILKNKTRVLVTHGVAFLPHMDQIVVLKDGNISEVGTYQQLLDAKGSFAEFLAQHAVNDEENGGNDADSEAEGDDDDEATDNLDSTAVNLSRTQRQRRQRKNLLASGSTSVELDRKSIQAQLLQSTASSKGKNTLIQAETAEKEGVKFSIYFTYFKAAGWDLSIGTLVLYTLFQGFSVGANMILSEWSELPIVNGTQDAAKRDTYLGVYGGLGLLQGIAIGIASATMALGILKSATGLHHQMLFRILRCPMYFFDTTPVGRIVNRFAKDVDTLDAQFPTILRMCLNGFFQMVSTLVVISYTTPVFIAVVVPIGIGYFLVQKLYVCTSRQLKRLESVTRSPIYSHFGESVVGSPTIRAYRQDERFIQDTEAKVDFNQKSYFPSITSNRWLAVRLETVGNLVIFFAALFAVLGRDTLNPGLVGLSVTYALQITLALNMVVRWFSELEANLVAVERMKEYMEVPQESAWEISGRKPPSGWPERGQVEFGGYKSRYREGLDLVLRNVTCEILPGEKIGIVGRTGAGKSSLTLGLFRIVEAAGGFIRIDGIDIATLGLHDVRGRITIIPQDPVLFSGSLRLNLDPFERHSDDELWRALELAHLRAFVKGLASGLDHEISEGGDNLSVGQRQLVCLARALLRKTKILVLDEATAAVDLETDDLIQTTIRAEFKDATIITIAHRLNTIMDSTRVIVLDQGEIREFDTPANLLQNKYSIFHSMARDAGLAQ